MRSFDTYVIANNPLTYKGVKVLMFKYFIKNILGQIVFLWGGGGGGGLFIKDFRAI